MTTTNKTKEGKPRFLHRCPDCGNRHVCLAADPVYGHRIRCTKTQRRITVNDDDKEIKP